MIAIDTSSWIAFLSNHESADDDTALVESALADHQACLPPVVLTELLSDPKLPREVATLLSQLPVLDPVSGRPKMVSKKYGRNLPTKVAYLVKPCATG